MDTMATGPSAERAFQGERRAPWKEGPRGLETVLDRWQTTGGVWRQVTLDSTLPARAEQAEALPEALAEPVRTALAARGIDQLYRHQARASARAREGHDVVVATPTASGKSLCYNLPVLEALAADPNARALYLFPTKALSRDQEHGLRALLRDAGLSHGAVTYDGDTPGDARRAARERSGVLISNPDMLHTGILPHHAQWARMFAQLRYVVIDELHTYRGVFGSHLANVLRRLQRVARFHGSDPQFLLSSATIGNPGEHASRLVGRDVEVVSENGAPAGPRRVLLYNPPVVNAELGIRESYIKAATRLTCDLVEAGVPTLVFGQSRNGVEVMLKYLRDRLARRGLDPDGVQAYRGGYLSGARRDVESALREGRIGCVVATNALELGIDVGSLGAVVCAGYPGTVAGLWQRFGRAGRRNEPALALLVASSAALDQYVARDGSYLEGAPVEQARIDPDNTEILVQHLQCAAFELPFVEGESFGDLGPDSLTDALDYLTEQHQLHPTKGGSGETTWHWGAQAYPANDVSLRNAGWDNFVVIDLDTHHTIAEMDWRSVHTMLHEQAIYQHAGEQYQVEKLDYDNHKAYVRRVDPGYYTTAMTHTKLDVLERYHEGTVGIRGMSREARIEAGAGDVSVTERVVGYKKIKFHTHENVGWGDVDLPEMRMDTTAFWLMFPEAFVGGIPHARAAVVDALRGLMGAMHTVAAIGLMTDPRDLGCVLGGRSETGALPGKGDDDPSSGRCFDPTLFFYDHIAGGVGLAARLFDERTELLRRTRSLVESCVCNGGCPACIGPDGGGEDAGSGGSVSRKRVALEILASLELHGRP